MKRHLLEGATIIVAAILCATIANALASRDRKVQLVGNYPNALKVPQEPSSAPVEPIGAPVTATTSTTSVAPETTTSAPPVTTTVPPTTTAAVTKPATSDQRPATTTQPPNAQRPAPSAQPVTPQPGNPATDIAKFKSHPDKPYLELGYADVAALHNAGALFLDARRTNIYEQGHISGAKPVSVWESDVDDKVRAIWNERQSEAEQAKPIVVYCAGGECEDSHNLAQKLFDAQFTNVYVYRDGFPDWQKHGGAVHTGGQP